MPRIGHLQEKKGAALLRPRLLPAAAPAGFAARFSALVLGPPTADLCRAADTTIIAAMSESTRAATNGELIPLETLLRDRRPAAPVFWRGGWITSRPRARCGCAMTERTRAGGG